MKCCYSKNYYQYIILNKRNSYKVMNLLNLDNKFSTKEEVEEFTSKTGSNFHNYCRYENGKLIYGSIRYKVYCQDEYGTWNDWYYEQPYEKVIPCNSYIVFKDNKDKNKLELIGVFSKEEFEKVYTSM